MSLSIWNGSLFLQYDGTLIDAHYTLFSFGHLHNFYQFAQHHTLTLPICVTACCTPSIENVCCAYLPVGSGFRQI